MIKYTNSIKLNDVALDNSPILVDDSATVALGKLQGQINAIQVTPVDAVAGDITLDLTQGGAYLYSQTNVVNSITIPNNSSVDFPSGTSIGVVLKGDGAIDLIPDTGVELYLASNKNAKNLSINPYGVANLLQIEPDIWFVSGEGAGAKPPSETTWIVDKPHTAGILMANSQPNYANIFPGVEDFCWEAWIKPQSFSVFAPTSGILVGWGSGENSPGWVNSNFALGLNRDASGIWAQCRLLGSTSTLVSALPDTSWDTWMHVAFARSGSVISAWLNGQLCSQLTGVTTDISSTNITSDGYFLFTGPAGDRDQTYSTPTGCQWRNMRYVIGSSVYGSGANFTPPLFNVDIPTISGSKYIWYPNQDTLMGYVEDPYPLNFESEAWIFNGFNGDTAYVRPTTILYSYPELRAMTVATSGGIPLTQGTWTNEGTAPYQPKITTNGPTPIIGTSCGDFTAQGTNVRISSTATSIARFNGYFRLYVWVYIPSGIIDECKTILAVETTDGFVLKIGRQGLGLNGLSICSFEGVELSYASHDWVLDSWNMIYVQKDQLIPIAAWVGASAQGSYANNLNMIDSGSSTFTFAEGGSVSIGCTSGSNVSSQMFFNQIVNFCAGFNQVDGTPLYPSDLRLIPMIAIPPNTGYAGLSGFFDFQGANGDTNIQPI